MKYNNIEVRPNDIKRFWKRVSKTDSCWDWTGAKHTQEGFGIFCLRKHVNVPAHRFIYSITIRNILSGESVTRTCKNYSCVNPSHLNLIRTLERFFSKIQQQRGGCWNWTGASNSWGYGVFSLFRPVYAHRFSYEFHYKRQVIRGLVLHHTCGNKICVNPEHLIEVTSKYNILQGNGWASANAKKTHCSRGHEYTNENTRHSKQGRVCRQCVRDRYSTKTSRVGLTTTEQIGVT